MIEKRRQEIIDIIFDHAIYLCDFLDSSDVYNAAYKAMDRIRETYSIDELESLYIETFKEFDDLELKYSKKIFIKKLEDYVKDLRAYPNIDMDTLEEYNYYALVAIDECPFKKDLVNVFLSHKNKLDTLKVTDIHKHFYDLKL